MRFADLHLHNHSTSFLWLWPNASKHRANDEYSPWTVVSDNRKALEKARMGSAYSQSDLVKAWNGKLRLAFNGLYPIERGFFKTSMEGITGENRLLKAFTRALASEDLPLRDFLHMAVQHVPDRLVDHVQSPGYDYWTFMNEEYEFAQARDGQETHNSIHTPFIWRQIFENERRRRRKFPEELDARGTYTIPRDRAHLAQLLQQEVVTMVLTIEGAHSFGTDEVTLGTRLARVDHVRTKWTHPIFFVTLAHHFDNGLCGHAHSFPNVANFVMDQSPNMNGPLRDGGRRMIRKLLALDNANTHDPAIGYRILIDVKHMSARSRKDYYEEFIKPCRAKGDTIPVIASHCGFTGLTNLQEHMDSEEREKDNTFDPSGRFSRWNINMCVEDVRMIHDTQGLFGLSMDQRIVGVHSDQKESGGRNSVIALWDTLKGVLEAVYGDDTRTDADKQLAWNIISLGSDFGGWIDPINDYGTLLKYADLRRDLIIVIDGERRAKTSSVVAHFTSAADVEAAVDRLCYGNAEAFVLKHYPV